MKPLWTRKLKNRRGQNSEGSKFKIKKTRTESYRRMRRRARRARRLSATRRRAQRGGGRAAVDWFGWRMRSAAAVDGCGWLGGFWNLELGGRWQWWPWWVKGEESGLGLG
ncbi:hypothetical protein AAHE18_18G122300 [Arachis hypogaea]